MAIFRYLAAKYAGKYPDNWYPADVKTRGRVDEYMAYHHTGTRGAVMPVFVSEVNFQNAIIIIHSYRGNGVDISWYFVMLLCQVQRKPERVL